MLSRLLREHQARQSERRELQGEPAPPRPSRGLIGWEEGGAPRLVASLARGAANRGRVGGGGGGVVVVRGG